MFRLILIDLREATRNAIPIIVIDKSCKLLNRIAIVSWTFFSIIHVLSISLSLALPFRSLSLAPSVCCSSFCVSVQRGTYPCTTHRHESHIVWGPCMHSLCVWCCTHIVLHENRSPEMCDNCNNNIHLESNLACTLHTIDWCFCYNSFFFTRSLFHSILFHSGRISANHNFSAAASSLGMISILAIDY